LLDRFRQRDLRRTNQQKPQGNKNKLMEADMDLTPELEERYRNHKVVTLPSSRGRSSVRDIAAATNNIQPQRPRSLSAGRSRHRQNNDLVQNIYDRMGVNVRKGQATEFNGSTGGSVEEAQSSIQSPPRIVGAVESQAASSDAGANFQARYRNAVSRGRAPGRGENAGFPSNEDPAPENSRRSRSLSRSRQLSQRWPPEPSNNNNQYPEEPATRPQVNAVSSPKKRSQMSPSPVLSPRAAPPSHATPSPLDASSSWTDQSGSNGAPVGYAGEEKKEDFADPKALTPVSIKDRISVYGKPGSSIKSKTGGIRRVDPTYAAQFAVRERPPKIDIYAESKKNESHSVPEKEDSEADNLNQQVVAPLNTSSTQESTVPTAAEEECAQPPRQQPSPLRKNQSFTSGASRSGKGNLANAFLAAINKPTESNNNNHHHPVASPPPMPSYKAPTPTHAGAPMAEINVSSDSGDLGGNDVNSVTGLSTVSGEEFSAGPTRTYKKPAPWQRGNSFHNRGASAIPPKPTPSSFVPSYGGGPAVAPPPANSHNNGGAMYNQSDLDRLVEERVQARVVELEARIEQKLRSLVNQMEEKIMHRLDTLEMKMTAAVTKRK